MTRWERLGNVSELVEKAKWHGNSVVDVQFKWKYDIFIFMKHPLDQVTRAWIQSDSQFETYLEDATPHGGAFSWTEGVIDEETSIVVIFPRPPRED